VRERLDPRAFPPAPGQGALAVQVRAGRPELLAAVARLDDRSARATTTAERTVLAGLGGGCSLPVGAHATLVGDVLDLVAFAGSPDGRKVLRVEETGADPHAVGRAAAEKLLAAGAAEVLA
jgi:hydroxymethylbilane synthase